MQAGRLAAHSLRLTALAREGNNSIWDKKKKEEEDTKDVRLLLKTANPLADNSQNHSAALVGMFFIGPRVHIPTTNDDAANGHTAWH